MDHSDKSKKINKTLKEELVEPASKSPENIEEAQSPEDLKPEEGGGDEEKSDYKPIKGSHLLNNFNKKRMLKHILELGCGEDTFDELQQIMKKVVPENIEEYINSHARKSQLHVHEECGNEVLTAMNEWIEYMKSMDLATNCHYELPLVMKTISKVVKHPDTGNDGINFEQLYLFLANVMNGEGSPELNPATREFLAETYAELMEVVESEQGQDDLALLEGKIKSTTKVITPDDPSTIYTNSLDPLSLESKLGV